MTALLKDSPSLRLGVALAAFLWLAPSSARAEGPPPPETPAPVAQAITLAFGTTFFTEVRVSTSGAVVDLSRLSRQGFYKLELIELLLLSARAKKPLRQLADRRRKGETLAGLAVSLGVDPDALYESALAVEEVVDRDYLPRFPSRRFRKEID